FFAGDGDRLATVAFRDDRSVQLWDVLTRKTLTTPILHELQVFNYNFTADGQRLFTGNGGGFRVWDAGKGEVVSGPLKDKLFSTSLAVSSGGRLVAALRDDEARVWSLAIPEIPPLTIHPPNGFSEVATSPDGRFRARVKDNTVQTKDTRTELPAGVPVAENVE